VLVLYATILISITLAQREKILNPKDLFKWSELLRCDVVSDDEVMYEKDDDSPAKKRVKVMGAFESEDDNSARIPIAIVESLDCKYQIV
jgi:hypothetical protein